MKNNDSVSRTRAEKYIAFFLYDHMWEYRKAEHAGRVHGDHLSKINNGVYKQMWKDEEFRNLYSVFNGLKDSWLCSSDIKTKTINYIRLSRAYKNFIFNRVKCLTQLKLKSKETNPYKDDLYSSIASALAMNIDLTRRYFEQVSLHMYDELSKQFSSLPKVSMNEEGQFSVKPHLWKVVITDELVDLLNEAHDESRLY